MEDDGLYLCKEKKSAATCVYVESMSYHHHQNCFFFRTTTTITISNVLIMGGWNEFPIAIATPTSS